MNPIISIDTINKWAEGFQKYAESASNINAKNQNLNPTFVINRYRDAERTFRLVELEIERLHDKIDDLERQLAANKPEFPTYEPKRSADDES